MPLIAQLCLCLSGLSLSFGQDGAGWGQMIQWEDSGRRYRLLNSGQEYQPAGESAGGTRVLLDGSRGSGVDLRRQAPTLPRTGSQTVRGNTRHPFGFGQVPDNWRGGSETSSTLGRFGETSSTSSRFVPSAGTGGGGGSRIRQTYSHNSVGPPFLPRPQPPFVAQPDFYPHLGEEAMKISMRNQIHHMPNRLILGSPLTYLLSNQQLPIPLCHRMDLTAVFPIASFEVVIFQQKVIQCDQV